MSGKNRIMIYGPKSDGTCVVEFKTAAGDALAINVSAGDALRGLPHSFREAGTPPFAYS